MQAEQHFLLRDKLESDILEVISKKLQDGETSIDISTIDDCIRKLSSMEAQSVSNPWATFDLIIGNNRAGFESVLYQKVDLLQESFTNEVNFPLLKCDEEEDFLKRKKKKKSRGREM